jgi:DNA repair protein RecN (Recombination protein N)
MLVSLHLKDFALIDEVEVGFEPGLCLLTGETGAGKSILVEALQLLAGARADAEFVRSGAREAALEALFDPGGDGAVGAWFAEAGIPLQGECVLRRTISLTGRSIASVNGRTVTLAQLRALGSLLVQIHGQHQGQVLLDEEEHRRLVDTLPAVAPPAAETARTARDLSALLERIRLSRRDAAELAQRAEALRLEAEEIGRVAPKPGEDADLRTLRNRLVHSEAIVEGAEMVRTLLRDGEFSAATALTEALRRIRDLSKLLPEWELIAKDLEASSSVVASVASAAEQAACTTQFDPEALERVEARLADFERLSRKYGPTLDDVIAHFERVRGELDALEAARRDPRALTQELDSCYAAWREAAGRLSGRRREAAAKLGRAVASELRELALEKARFEVDLPPKPVERPEEAVATGLEDVRFLFSANPGEPVKPLAKIASGGELSRTMLAILTAVRDRGGPKTLVFDEVDSGIGGRPAERVGRRLRDLASSRQVLCITHLPQIAAFACHHLRVTKRASGARTLVEIAPLEGAERVEEMARMLAGERVTETARRHARELLGSAEP